MVEETLFLPGFTGPESAVFPGESRISTCRLWLWDIEDPAQMMKTEDFFDFRRAWMNCHLQIF